VAEVVKIEYFKVSEAPIPFDKVKKIIGKVEKNIIEDDI
jgi:hypothetical protein